MESLLLDISSDLSAAATGPFVSDSASIEVLRLLTVAGLLSRVFESL